MLTEMSDTIHGHVHIRPREGYRPVQVVHVWSLRANGLHGGEQPYEAASTRSMALAFRSPNCTQLARLGATASNDRSQPPYNLTHRARIPVSCSSCLLRSRRQERGQKDQAHEADCFRLASRACHFPLVTSFRNLEIEHLVGDQLLQPPILVFVQPSVPRVPAVVRSGADLQHWQIAAVPWPSLLSASASLSFRMIRSVVCFFIFVS